MKIPLLKSKFSQPPILVSHQARPRLVDHLNQKSSSKLILLSAPAGYGKTTLVSTWAAGCQLPVAWLTLDSGDNDPFRFFTYLVAALHSVDANSTQALSEILDPLEGYQPVNTVEWMSAVIEKLEALPGMFVFVLDDYHVINNLQIHQAIDFLLDHMPLQMRFVLSTRVDPPLGVAKLRARGELNELRQADLRFTPAETQAFVIQWIGDKLPSLDVSMLSNRTEGWIAAYKWPAWLFVMRLPGGSRSLRA